MKIGTITIILCVCNFECIMCVRERERAAETDREGVCLRKGSYLASCFHREKKSADPMTVSSMNLLMKTGSLSTNWWGLPPTLQQTTAKFNNDSYTCAIKCLGKLMF